MELKKIAWHHVLKWRNFLKRDKNKKIKIKEGWLLLQDNISLLLVQLCHPGTKWFGITHWISPAMFLCKSHMINHCLIHNEMQTFAARRHNAELFLHFLFVSLYYTAKLFIIFIFTTSNASKACRKGQKLCKLSINLEAAVWIFWKFSRKHTWWGPALIQLRKEDV